MMPLIRRIDVADRAAAIHALVAQQVCVDLNERLLIQHAGALA